MTQEREDYMRRQEADHALLDMRTQRAPRRADSCRRCGGGAVHQQMLNDFKAILLFVGEPLADLSDPVFLARIQGYADQGDFV